MPILKITFGSAPIRRLIAGTRLQNRAAIRGFSVARVSAATGPAQALDLLVGAITGNIADIARSLGNDVQQGEDAFLDGHHPPDARDLIRIRRRLAQIHRLLTGMRGVFQRLEEDEELPEGVTEAA